MGRETRQRVVLFGGITPHGLFGDTWEWDGVELAQRSTAASRPHAVARDGVGRGAPAHRPDWRGAAAGLFPLEIDSGTHGSTATSLRGDADDRERVRRHDGPR